MLFENLKGVISFEKAQQDEEFVKDLQSLLKAGGFYTLEIDGIWGDGTEQAVQDAAEKFFLNNYEKRKFGKSFYNKLVKHNAKVETEKQSRAKAKTSTTGIFTIQPVAERQLTEADFQRAADKLGCEVAMVKAINEVESRGGFLRDGKIKILFEAHIFSQHTKGKYDALYPGISSPSWDRSLYRGNEAEYPRLQQAMELDRDAALKSCSYGNFQIMGFNHKICGYTSVDDFVRAMHTSKGQIDALVSFIIRRGLADELQRHDWHGFSKGYNGRGYLKNKYHIKLQNAYKKFA